MATFDHEYSEQERQLLKIADDEFEDKPELRAKVIKCIGLARQLKKLKQMEREAKQMESEVESNRPVVKLLLPRNISFIAAAKTGIMDGAFMYAADQVATASLGDWKGRMLIPGSFLFEHWFYDPANLGNPFNHMMFQCIFIALNSPYFYSFGGLNLSIAAAGFDANILPRINAYLHDWPVDGDSVRLILRDSMVLCLYVLVPTVLPAPRQISYWPLPRYVTESTWKVTFAPWALSLLFEIGILFGTIYRYLRRLIMYQLPRLFHLAWVIALLSLQWFLIEFQRVATHYSKPKDGLKYKSIDKPADQIRLLVLQPKTRFGLIECSLEPRSLDSAGSFEAISYRWSDNGQPMAILVDQQRKIVSNTVYLLLRSLQSDSKRVLWLDSICINQDDEKEKERQIPLMRKVYSSATRVIGWVGDSPASAGALRYLSQLPTALNSNSNSRTDKIWHARENHRFKDSFDQNWSAVESLLEHTWFSRVWVMQEIVLAKEVVVRHSLDEEIPWEVLNSGLGKISKGSKMGPLAFGKDAKIPESVRTIRFHNIASIEVVKSLREEFQKSPDDMAIDIGHAMILAAGLQATDPRDTIYGLLGLLSEETRKAIPVNYQEKIGELVLRAARHSLLHEKLGLYYHVMFPPANTLEARRKFQDLGLPTWCPHWLTPWVGKSPPVGGNLNTATHLARHIATVNGYPRRLIFRGCDFDSVQACSSVVPVPSSRSNQDEAVVQAFIKTGIELCEELSLNIHSQLAKDLFWRTVLSASGEGSDTQSEIIRQINKSLDNHKTRESVYTPIMLPYSQEAYHPYFEAGRVWDKIGFRMVGKRFCVTKSGRTAIVPHATEVGDRICVIFGAPVPFVVSPKVGKSIQPDKPNEFVGTCWVNGIMNGELAKKTLAAQDLLIE